jgi:CzcA family heavy metal efflux pump
VKLFDHLLVHRRLIYLLVGGLSIAGISAALSLPSAIYPEVTFQRIMVVAEGSALGAYQVVFAITRPIEEAVSIVPGVTRVRSKSIRGGSEVAINFTPKTDMQLALQQVQARMNEVRSMLPPEVDIRVERLTPSLFPILSYNLEGGDPAVLYDIARYQIAPVLSRIPGVGRADVQGNNIREIQVLVDPARLAAARMTYDDLANAIIQATSVNAVGRMAKDYKQYLIITDQAATTPDDIANTVVKDGLRVRDLGNVVPGTEDRVRIIAGDRGRPAALINVSRQIGGNTTFIADSVASTMKAIQPTLPPGVRLRPVYDQASLVREATTNVRDAMIIGAILAVIILLLFLGEPLITAVSATSIPLTLAISVFFLKFLGGSFNLMSLGAMAIAIGIVIDDSVVICENIVRHMTFTENRNQAIADALQELIWPVTSSTITTVVVFLPLGLLSGIVGQFFTTLGVTLTVAVLISLVLAMTLIPILSFQLLASHHRDKSKPRRLEVVHRTLERISDWIGKLPPRYERALASVLHHPKRLAIVAILLIIGGVIAFRFVGTGFLPIMDEGAFVLDYFTPGGTALTETDREVKVVEGILREEPEVTGTSRRTGAEMGLFATEQNTGDIVARLKPRSQRSRTIFEIIDDVRTKAEGALPRLRIEFVLILSDVINDLAGAANPVEIKLFGANLGELEAYAKALEPKLEPIAGVVDLYNGVPDPGPETLMRIKEAETARIGLTPQQVSDQVRGALLGVPAGQVRYEDRAVAVRVRAPDSIRFNVERFGQLPIPVPGSGESAPLGALVELRDTATRSQYLRENQREMVAITAGVEGRALGKVMADVKNVLASNKPPAGVTIELGGQYASQQESFKSMLIVLALAALSVVTVMVIQFKSFVEPLIILAAAPVSFVGAILLLLITGTQLNVSSLMGLILLVGLIVKNGIILIDFTYHRMEHGGLALEPALREAAQTRLRPILMTTLCTLFGLLPLALGLGAGAEMQRPLALAVIGGLALSTPITLFIVPTMLLAVRGRDFTLDRRSA